MKTTAAAEAIATAVIVQHFNEIWYSEGNENRADSNNSSVRLDLRNCGSLIKLF